MELLVKLQTHSLKFEELSLAQFTYPAMALLFQSPKIIEVCTYKDVSGMFTTADIRTGDVQPAPDKAPKPVEKLASLDDRSGLFGSSSGAGVDLCMGCYFVCVCVVALCVCVCAYMCVCCVCVCCSFKFQLRKRFVQFYSTMMW